MVSQLKTYFAVQSCHLPLHHRYLVVRRRYCRFHLNGVAPEAVVSFLLNRYSF